MQLSGTLSQQIGEQFHYKRGTGCVQCTLRKPCVGCDWQRHYSILGTLPFRDYSDVTLIPLHG